MESFGEWYAKKYGLVVGQAGATGEPYNQVIERLLNAVIEYMDLLKGGPTDER